MIGFNLHWLMAHFIGDYLLQNDYMAENKKKSNLACLFHIVTYMLPFLLTSLTPLQFLLVAVQHFAQDRTNFVRWYCKVTGKFKKEVEEGKPFWGFFIIDNIFHAIWILLVLTYVN